MPGSFKFQVLCFGQSANKGNFHLSLKKRRQLSLRMAFIALNNMGKGWRIACRASIASFASSQELLIIDLFITYENTEFNSESNDTASSFSLFFPRTFRFHLA